MCCPPPDRRRTPDGVCRPNGADRRQTRPLSRSPQATSHRAWGCLTPSACARSGASESRAACHERMRGGTGCLTRWIAGCCDGCRWTLPPSFASSRQERGPAPAPESSSAGSVRLVDPLLQLLAVHPRTVACRRPTRGSWLPLGRHRQTDARERTDLVKHRPGRWQLDPHVRSSHSAPGVTGAPMADDDARSAHPSLTRRPHSTACAATVPSHRHRHRASASTCTVGRAPATPGRWRCVSMPMPMHRMPMPMPMGLLPAASCDSHGARDPGAALRLRPPSCVVSVHPFGRLRSRTQASTRRAAPTRGGQQRRRCVRGVRPCVRLAMRACSRALPSARACLNLSSGSSGSTTGVCAGRREPREEYRSRCAHGAQGA